jgi:hypothetical protein
VVRRRGSKIGGQAAALRRAVVRSYTSMDHVFFVAKLSRVNTGKEGFSFDDDHDCEVMAETIEPNVV